MLKFPKTVDDTNGSCFYLIMYHFNPLKSESGALPFAYHCFLKLSKFASVVVGMIAQNEPQAAKAFGSWLHILLAVKPPELNPAMAISETFKAGSFDKVATATGKVGI